MRSGSLIDTLTAIPRKDKAVRTGLIAIIMGIFAFGSEYFAFADHRGMGDRSAPHMCTATTACADLVVPNFEHEDHLKRFVISRYPPFPQPAYIALRLPSNLAGEDGRSSEATLGAQFFIWPDLSGASDIKNTKFGLNCTGYCGGRMLITVGYGFATPSLGDRSFNAFLSMYSDYGATFKPAKSIKGFDIALDEEPSPARDFGTNTIYFAPPSPGHSSTSLECARKTPFPLCKAKFSSDKHPGLTMDVSTSAFELHDWQDVQRRIVDLIDQGVVAQLQ